ncbi:hypothetical protein KJ877_10190 [bacterium]|nr:hypothetical protein [bacterium]MBU1991140.1 hypothetical protein [bacterium]
MKLLLVALLFMSLLHADEIQRIESIVKDIKELRNDYEECQLQLKAKFPHAKTSEASTDENKHLSECAQKNEELLLRIQKQEDMINENRRILKDEKEKNIILKSEIDNYSVSNEDETNLGNKLNKLEKELKTKNNLLKAKENDILTLINNNIEKIKAKDKEIEYLKNKINAQALKKDAECEEKNVFPKLMMKEEYSDENASVEIVLESFEAATFYLNTQSNIYDAINGNAIEEWEEKRSFTSNQKASGWMKITGYFVDKKWQRSEKEMWIKESNINKKILD